MSWQTILKVDSLPNATPIYMKGTKNRRAKIFDLIVGVSPSASFEEFKEPTTKENLKEHLLSMERSKARKLLNSLKPIMEMDEEDFHELHEGKPGFNYRNYKKVRQPALGFFNELMSAIARPEGEKQDKISPTLLNAIEKFKAGDDSALMPMLEQGTERFKTELRQVIDDEFYVAARESENNEKIVELLGAIDKEFARKATAEKEDYESKNLTSQLVQDYLTTAFKLPKSYASFVAPSSMDRMNAKQFKRIFSATGRAIVSAPLLAIIDNSDIDTVPVAFGSKIVGQNRLQSLLQEADAGVKEDDAEGVTELGEGDIPKLLREYSQSQWNEEGEATREGLGRFRAELVSKGETKNVEKLDTLIEANQYYLTGNEAYELAEGEKLPDAEEWNLNRRFSHLLDGDELKEEAKTLYNKLEPLFVDVERGNVKDEKFKREYSVLDITGSIKEVKNRIAKVKALFSMPTSEGINSLLTSIDVGRKEGNRKAEWNKFKLELFEEARKNSVSFNGVIGMLMLLEKPYNHSSSISVAVRKYYLTGEEDDEENLESVLKRDYKNIRDGFYSSVKDVIEKIANIRNDDTRIKDDSRMKNFRDYLRTNLVK